MTDDDVTNSGRPVADDDPDAVNEPDSDVVDDADPDVVDDADSDAVDEPDPAMRSLLDRAAETLRAAPEPAWETIRGRVVAAFRATPTLRSAPLRVRSQSDPAGSIFVGERVLRDILAKRLRHRYPCIPTAMSLVIVDADVREVHIEVIAAYGTALQPLGVAIRTVTRDTVEEILGTTPDRIDVMVVDVVEAHTMRTRSDTE